MPSEANPADAPSSEEGSILEPQVAGELASLQQVAQLGRVIEGPGMSIDRPSIKWMGGETFIPRLP